MNLKGTIMAVIPLMPGGNSQIVQKNMREARSHGTQGIDYAREHGY